MYLENNVYQFSNVYIDDFNFGERCKFEIVQDKITILGTMGLRLELQPEGVHIQNNANGFYIFGGEYSLCIRYAENNFVDVQMINVLVNVFRTGQGVCGKSPRVLPSKYVCSLDEQGDEFQVFYDSALAVAPDGQERQFRLLVQGLNNYSIRLKKISMGEYVRLEQYFIGYVLVIASNDYLVPVYKLSPTKEACEKVEQFHKGREIACSCGGEDAVLYSQNDSVYLDVSKKTELKVKN